jgi:hypothetical protein
MSAPLKGLLARVAQRSVAELTRVACVLALLGLSIMIFPLLFPSAIAVVLSMGIGHMIGIAAFGVYLLAVIFDLARRRGD